MSPTRETEEERNERLKNEANEILTSIASKTAWLGRVGAADGMKPVVILHFRVYEGGAQVGHSGTYKVRPSQITEEVAFQIAFGRVKRQDDHPSVEESNEWARSFRGFNEPLEGNEIAIACYTVHFGEYY
jgi:hypothetical protein